VYWVRGCKFGIVLYVFAGCREDTEEDDSTETLTTRFEMVMIFGIVRKNLISKRKIPQNTFGYRGNFKMTM